MDGPLRRADADGISMGSVPGLRRVQVAAAAQADGADHVLWAALQLLPHPSEKELSDHPSLPRRFRHFYHNYEMTRIPLLEARLFRDGTDVQFGFDHLAVLPQEVRETHRSSCAQRMA
jgi:hypothetical protein